MKKILTIYLSLLSLPLFANELTMYFIHSPLNLNWRSPQSIAASTVENSLIPKKLGGRYSIGHVYEEINCPGLGVHEFTGQTSSTDIDTERVLKLGWALGAMLATEPGQLDTTDYVKAALPPLYKSGRVSILKIAISENACERIVDYLTEYRALGLDKIYAGLHARPLYKEGSGCSAFGASVMEVAGLILPEQESAWTMHLGVPYKYIGGPRTGKKINIVKMLTAFGSEWTPKNEPHNGLWIDFYDPSLMHHWVKSTHKKIRRGQSPYSFETEAFVRGNAKGVYMNMTDFETPTGPIFLK